MYKTIARGIHDIAVYKDELSCLCNKKAVEIMQEKHKTTWVFNDNSTLSLDDFGAIKIDGRYCLN